MDAGDTEDVVGTIRDDGELLVWLAVDDDVACGVTAKKYVRYKYNDDDDDGNNNREFKI